MAIANSVISGIDTTSYAGDKPTFFACVRATAARWTAAQGVGGADITHSDYPASAAYDGHTGVVTTPATAVQTRYFNVALPGTTVDALFLHVPDADGGDITIYLTDGTTYTAVTGYSSSHFDSHKRLFIPCLQVSGDTGDTQRKFTGVTHAVILFDAGVGETCQPQVAELSAGAQRQMPYEPLQSGDDDEAQETMVERFESKAGVITKALHGGPRRVEQLGYFCNSTTVVGKLTDLWADTDGGQRSVVWCRKPQSAPEEGLLMVMENKFALPRSGPIARQTTIALVEQGSYFLGDE